jgi:uncharacterized protein YjdB
VKQNTAVVTDAARIAESLNLSDYGASVSAHLNGDYSSHNQVAVYNFAYPITTVAPEVPSRAAHEVAASVQMRMSVTLGSIDYAVVVPAVVSSIPFASSGTGGGSSATVPPTFTLQPETQEVEAGATVTLTVAVTGTTPMAFQWRKDSVNIEGANSTTLVIADFQAADIGGYACLAINSRGATISNTAQVTIPGVGGSASLGGDDNWTGIFKPPFHIPGLGFF